MLGRHRGLRHGETQVNLVALVDDEGIGTVTLDSHGLDVAGQVVGLTITVSAGAVVVVHGDHGDGVDVEPSVFARRVSTLLSMLRRLVRLRASAWHL